MDKEGNITYKNVMMIKNISITTSVENGDFLTVTGRELKYLLHQRIVWQQTTLTGTVENGIRKLVNENAITPTDSNRVIPSLTLAESKGLTDTIEKQITGDYLDEAITEICKSYNYGWEIYGYNNNLIFNIYEGLDRSYNQTERPFVIFSDKFDNLYNTEYQVETEKYANTTLIGGEGEGLDRIYTTVGNDNAGFNRYETFTDGKSISRNKGNDNEISLTDYYLLLQEKGKETLADLSVTEGFSGEVITDVNFTYNEDFFIGDLVTVINQYGISRNVRVLSSIESEDQNGNKLIPQFNI